MCGINGFIQTDEHAIGNIRGLVSAMNDSIAHRGPDDEGIWTDNQIALGHRRLSIIDLSKSGHQPLVNNKGNIYLVCNGEIYNYLELRKKCSDWGYQFQGNTDVEVILPLYERYGVRCVDFLVGMFAFAIWDGRHKKLLLARDRVGEKPLYFSSGGGWIAFSSEPKGLLTIPFVDRRINEEAIPLLLVHQSLPPPITMFRGIESLPPSTVLEWEGGRIQKSRYWNLDFSRKVTYGTKEALAEYEEVLSEAVSGCLIADVPVALMLSGGIDSSSITALAVKERENISSFCVGQEVDGKKDVEFERASKVAKILNTSHQNIQYEVNLDQLPRLISQYDQPIWSLVVLYADCLTEQMRREAKVVLTGNGADEVFGGYSAYALNPSQQMIGSVSSFLPDFFLNQFPDRISEKLLRVGRNPFWEWRGLTLTTHARFLMKKLCTVEFSARWFDYEAGKFVSDAAQECSPSSLLDATRYSDLMVCHQHGHCLIPDISGMNHSLEYRSPFLSHKVIEFAATLPKKFILPWPNHKSRTKAITKLWAAQFLPKDIVYARKVGFGYGVSFSDYLIGSKSQYVRDQLINGKYLDLDIFSREGAVWALENSLSAVIMLLSFSIWADQYIYAKD